MIVDGEHSIEAQFDLDSKFCKSGSHIGPKCIEILHLRNHLTTTTSSCQEIIKSSQHTPKVQAKYINDKQEAQWLYIKQNIHSDIETDWNSITPKFKYSLIRRMHRSSPNFTFQSKLRTSLRIFRWIQLFFY